MVGLTTAGCSTLFPGDSGSTSGPTTATGCSAATTKHVAPGGYYVSGNSVCTATGAVHQFHGVDRPSLEWSPVGQASDKPTSTVVLQLSAADFQLMAGWQANVVRIALNQDFWIAGSQQYNAAYASNVDQAVRWAEEAGMDVILDLHWSDQGVLGSCISANTKDHNCQQVMADMNSIGFWADVAGRYKNDGRVLFELYNEPHDVTWNVWKSGGMTSGGWMAAGMQQLYDTVRAAGADNLVVIGGLNFAFDLSGVPSNRISGYNIIYATHPYGGSSDKGPNSWDSNWGFLTKTDPVIMTEFGDGQECSGSDYTPAIDTYVSAVISYADQQAAGWTAWAWFKGGCTFPSLISDWTGTPTPPGMIVKSALAGYSDPAPSGKRDAGATDASGTGGAAGAGGSTGATDGGAHDGAAGGQGAAGDASVSG